MDLFDYMKEVNEKESAPLASRLRPDSLDMIVGQEHILGKDKFLYRAIKADKLSSIIFFGPPGCGKTTIAKVIANTTKSNFKQINATTAGKKEMEEATSESKVSFSMYKKKTILFIDEIHRFNKSQQDYLLPFVEDGTIILIGATTENPFFEVNKALISRSRVLELKSLSYSDIESILNKAIKDKERGMGKYELDISEDAIEFISRNADGDARSALNALELAILTTDISTDGKIHIDINIISECIQKKVLKYDKDGNGHYDTISAFIKSMRGSDPDATMYYLAKMLYAGEDIKFIARRIVICAAEDVGLADANALCVATNAFLAVERVGMPEARIILAEAANYVACAPKSNASYMAINAALKFVQENVDYDVPKHIRNANYEGEKDLGTGVGYKYAHDYKNHYVKQQYLPDEIKDSVFLNLTDMGFEKNIKEYLEKIKKES